MRRLLCCLFVLLLAIPVVADEQGHGVPVIIDTDMGIDDAVTMALALQAAHIHIPAIVATEGVASREFCVESLERMLERFNRKEITLYEAAETGSVKTVPPFRPFAQGVIAETLPTDTESFHVPFSPKAYTDEYGKVAVLVLGPLTNVAAAIKASPDVAKQIDMVIVAGESTVDKNWNLRFDPEAFEVVKKAGIKLLFVPSSVKKPKEWAKTKKLPHGAGTSIGESFINQLLADEGVLKHYLERFDEYSDELALIYQLHPELFMVGKEPGTVVAVEESAVVSEFVELFNEGRQHKDRVVLADLLPEGSFQQDIARRRPYMVAKNGWVEWSLQLITNEMHDHMGAYSVIGVKMGLRAAELLNAAPHSMQVVSHCAAYPPVSCLNDGIIVSSGSTPGRALFKHEPGPKGATSVSFSYNGRTIVLDVKKEYKQQIRGEIRKLLSQYTLEDPEYWLGVRKFGIHIWENWHRKDLFEITDSNGTEPKKESKQAAIPN